MTGLDPKRIPDPCKFIEDLYSRLVGLKTDLENVKSRYEGLEYHSTGTLDTVSTIIRWMESQQK